MWAKSPYVVEVWTESRSIAGVIQHDCQELAVSLYPCGGFASVTLAWEAVDNITSQYETASWVIFYVGDYDPAGVLIDKAIEREIREHLEKSGQDISLHFERVGITEQQIAEYDLPTKPRKAGDKRALHVAATVEAEAMPASTLREILRDRIEDLLPPDALRVAKLAEEEGRKAIDLVALAMQNGA